MSATSEAQHVWFAREHKIAAGAVVLETHVTDLALWRPTSPDSGADGLQS
jgi:hypothetical protein